MRSSNQDRALKYGVGYEAVLEVWWKMVTAVVHHLTKRRPLLTFRNGLN